MLPADRYALHKATVAHGMDAFREALVDRDLARWEGREGPPAPEVPGSLAWMDNAVRDTLTMLTQRKGLAYVHARRESLPAVVGEALADCLETVLYDVDELPPDDEHAES